jgi:hypothetical protein
MTPADRAAQVQVGSQAARVFMIDQLRADVRHEEFDYRARMMRVEVRSR